MPLRANAWAALAPRAPLTPFAVSRRDVGAHDVLIEIAWCGVCHSDLHHVRDEWGGATFPMVPGHEIVGRVTKTGGEVTKLRTGDLAGVGCLVDSCRDCRSCRRDLEQFCETGPAWTYSSTEMDRTTPTYGGYSSHIVADEAFVLRVAPGQDLAAVAPLLCAGVTTYSPLRHWRVMRGERIAVVGLGGLGHMAVKLAASFGAEVTVLSTSRAKEADARRLGAADFAVTTQKGTLKKLAGRFDLLLDTLSVEHDLNALLSTVRVDGAMVLVGMPPHGTPLKSPSLIGGRRTLAGSLIGGIAETQEMLDYCAENSIGADVEVIPMQKINEAFERMIRSDVRYRFVIDMKTL
jgi:uncharacterized zinc-type alcohol dehydrogenase-like protein